LLPAEFDDRQAIIQHFPQARRDQESIVTFEREPRAIAALFNELPPRIEGGPLRQRVTTSVEHDIHDDLFGAIDVMPVSPPQLLRRPVVDELSRINEEHDVAHLAEFAQDVAADEKGLSPLGE